MKKEIPILFSTPMVQAILAGRKTMTRRVVNPQPPEDVTGFDMDEYPSTMVDRHGNLQEGPLVYGGIADTDFTIKCPFGRPGDRLWVKETFTVLDHWEQTQSVQVLFEDAATLTACLTDQEWAKFQKWQQPRGKKTSLFLFKSLSRVWLEVTDVRVERLHRISETDAIAEGMPRSRPTKASKGLYHTAPVGLFQDLWRSINGEESWNLNPWVWVVSFKVLSTKGKP
jgi:hypothetical protein